MENSLKLQMDVKNNAEDLHRYMLDLLNWEDEMNKKDSELRKESGKVKVTDLPPPRNRAKRNSLGKMEETKKSSDRLKPKKIRAYDYSAWDKYDADKACAEIDAETLEDLETKYEENNLTIKEEEIVEENEQHEVKESTEKDQSAKNIDEAFYEKELGNQFVRKEKWEDAIKCYTRAINLCSNNPIYYANRALCFIKLNNFKSAEVDATIAIQLDKTYTKAYQRRAFARAALGQILEAKSDYEEVLKLEPKNTYANFEISKLDKKLKSSVDKDELKNAVKPIFNPRTIFKSESKKDKSIKNESHLKSDVKKIGVNEKKSDNSCKKPDFEKNETVKREDENKDQLSKGKGDEQVPVNKTKDKSNIFGDIPDGFSIIKPVYIPAHLRSKKPLRRVPVKDVFSASETFNELVNFTNQCQISNNKPEKLTDDRQPQIIHKSEPDIDKLELPVPETSVQFNETWKLVKKSAQHTYSFLKKIKLDDLPRIFKHSLESDLFSELISMLSKEEFLKDSEFVYNFLYHLSFVQRFGSLVLFMSASDKANLKKCISSLSEKSAQEWLEELYELKQKI